MAPLPYSQVQQNNRRIMQIIVAKPGFQALSPADQQLFRQWAATGDAPPNAAPAIDRAVQSGVIPNGPSALKEFGTAGLLALGLTAIPAAGGTVAAGGVDAVGLPTSATIAAPVAAGGATAAVAAPAVAAGTTAASVAPAVAPVAAKSASSWLLPLAGSVVSAGGQLLGAKMQTDANAAAAAIQAKSAADALAFEKQRYTDLQGRLAPYVSSGQSATDRMTQLLGLNASPGTSSAPPTSSAAMPSNGAGMTLMRAPDGSTMSVPQAQVDHYRQQGAVPA